ncbi:MAG: hypothetical protein JWO62_1001 [Acidimicrobiaceae bacterium]|nr:hypothetical protein [Acidimicrobiaceae bacterium]
MIRRLAAGALIVFSVVVVLALTGVLGDVLEVAVIVALLGFLGRHLRGTDA